MKTYFTHGPHVWEQKRQRRRKLSVKHQEELMKILTEKSPADCGSDWSRWTLALLKEKVSFLTVYKRLSGIFYLLSSLRLAWIRCRDRVESIDRAIAYKIRRKRRILGYVRTHPQQAVMPTGTNFRCTVSPFVAKHGRRKARNLTIIGVEKPTRACVWWGQSTLQRGNFIMREQARLRSKSCVSFYLI